MKQKPMDTDLHNRRSQKTVVDKDTWPNMRAYSTQTNDRTRDTCEQ